MTSVARRISDAAVTALDAALPATMYRNLDYALEQQKLPACVVQSGDDAGLQALPGSRCETATDIEVHYLVKNGSDPQLAADALDVAGHAALFADPRFGGLAVMLERIGAIWRFDSGDCVDRTVMYRVTYRTAINNLETTA